MSNSSSNSVTYSNSTLPLFHQCPPGLGDGGCDQATCNSTFVVPNLRTLKSNNVTSCTQCDEGFSGLNCNVCKGVQSCANRQLQANSGLRGVATSSSSYGQSNNLSSYSVNNTLTCNNQPKAITASYLQCQIEQPTLSALFPGNITLTGIKVANVPNFTSTGMGAWDAQANSSYMSVFLDGVEQFYCQAQDCINSNSTNAVQSSMAKWGTNLWSCGKFSCSCIEGTKICSNPTFSLGNIINSIGGSLDFPCDYVNPDEPFGQTQCKLSTAALNQFVGPDGLALDQCSFGECLSQYTLEQDWQDSTLAAQSSNNNLSNGVIAGLAILGVAIFAFLSIFAFGYYLRRRASLLERIDDQRAIGICWNDVHYYAFDKNRKSLSTPIWMKSKSKSRKSINQMNSMEQARMENEQIPMRDQKSDLSSLEINSHIESDQQDNQCHILRGISSYALPGTLNFIIGPSGAGKSSLVDVLAGRQKRGNVQGELTWLSEFELNSSIRSNFVQRQIALVDQDDSINLPAYMTVKEVLIFAAELSTPENVPKQERIKIIEETMTKLGLNHIANQRIGDVRTRGISGGERRRVSLAVAMVGRPKILIADECTSGLDAFSAQRVITALRELSCGIEGGTTVIATLHQPSSQVFDLADHIILLSQGEILFDGSPSSSLEFCRDAGVPVPPGHNVADHLLTYAFEKPLKRPSGNMIANENNEDVQQSQSKSKSEQEVNSRINILQNFNQTKLSINHSSSGSRPVTTFITQLHALTSRSFLMTKREMTGALAHILGTIIISIFVGGCFYKVQLNLGGFQNRVGSMFFVMILLLFSSLSALVNLAKMRLLMMRERANGLYSPWSWVAAHLVYDLLLLRAIPAILITCIVYWMVGLKASASDFFEFMLITVIFAWVIAIYNMILAALIEDLATAILLAALFVLFNIFMAGFLMSLNSMPSVVRWLRWIVPAKYALEAVADQQLQNLLFIDTFAGVPVKTDVSLFANKLFGFDSGAFYRDLIVLACGFLVGFSGILFASVWWRMRELR